MSEIQRFEITQLSHGGSLAFQPSPVGGMCLYRDLLWYRNQYRMALIINIVVVVACGLLAALLVHEKAARGPVAVPMGAGEKASLLRDVQDMQKSRDDYKAMALNYKAQIKALTAKVDGHVAQLEALQARGKELDTLNREQAQRMATPTGLVLEAKRILGPLGVQHVKVVEP